MIIEQRKTLNLFPETEKERDLWLNLIANYSWAEGEFGKICTESAFLEFCTEAIKNTSIDPEIEWLVTQCISEIKKGIFTDVCLEMGISDSGT